MKLKHLLLSLISIVLFSSCMKDNSDDMYLYGGLATAHQIKDAEYFFKFDNGKTLYPVGSTFNADVMKDSARVMVTFVLEDENIGGYDYTGRLQYLDLVLTKNTMMFDLEMPDTLGTDEVIIRDGYIYHKYLNLDFAVKGQYSTHMINLVCVDSEQHPDSAYVDVTFTDRIESGNKVGSVLGIVCYDISEIQTKYPGKKGIRVNTTDYQYNTDRSYDFDFPVADEETEDKIERRNVSASSFR